MASSNIAIPFNIEEEQVDAQNNLVSIQDTAYWIDPLLKMARGKTGQNYLS